MKYAYKPISNEELPEKDLILEEYKILSEQSRFIMTRYMQALIVHLAFMGYVLVQLSNSPSKKMSIIITTVVLLVNIVSFYAASWFKSMAYHSLNRQAILADTLGFQRPHPMIWGYYGGIIWLTAASIGLVILTLSIIF